MKSSEITENAGCKCWTPNGAGEKKCWNAQSLKYFPVIPVSFLVNSPTVRDRRNPLSILPCISAVRRYRERKHGNALVDLSARNITVLQVLDVDKNLVRAREIGAGRASKETGRAGEADAKGTELSPSARWGIGEASGDGASGDGGGVRLSIAERTIGSDEYLLAARNDNV